MIRRQDQAARPVLPLSGFFFYFGYFVFWFVLIVLFAEVVAMMGWGFYHGYFSRLATVAPELPAPRGDRQAMFSLKSLITIDLASASPAYENIHWAEDFWRESRQSSALWHPRYEPFRIWGNGRLRGRYVNVDDTPTGFWRRTLNSCTAGHTGKLQLWVFGGSTVFGGETPDFATLPSLLSKKLNTRSGDCVAVTNFGVPGYVINQEVILLTQLLKAGHRPDAVVFYDGYNDAYTGAFSPGIPSAHGDLLPIKARFEETAGVGELLKGSHALRAVRGIMQRLASAPVTKVSERGDVILEGMAEVSLDAKVRATLDNYEANLHLVRALAKTYRFEAKFFWQPTLAYGAKTRNPFETACIENPRLMPRDQSRTAQAVYAEAEHRSSPRGAFVFLGRVFDGASDPIYVDSIHLGPRGNEIVAGAIADTLGQLARQDD